MFNSILINSVLLRVVWAVGTFRLLQSSPLVVALEVIIFAVFRHSLQVGVGVQQVLSPLRDLRGDEGVQVGCHCFNFLLLLA